MEINKDRLWQLLDDAADGTYRELARLLGVPVSQLHRVLNGESKAGPVFWGKLRTYCKEHGLEFEEFILEEPGKGKL